MHKFPQLQRNRAGASLRLGAVMGLHQKQEGLRQCPQSQPFPLPSTSVTPSHCQPDSEEPTPKVSFVILLYSVIFYINCMRHQKPFHMLKSNSYANTQFMAS